MWEWLSQLWRRGLDWLGQAIDNATSALVWALQRMGAWLSDTFGDLFTALTGYLSTILRPFLDLIGGLFYLLQSVVDVVIMVMQVLLLLVQVLLATVGGLFRSLAALVSWDPATVAEGRNPFATGTDLILGQWAAAGGDVVASILSWAVWLLFAVGVVRLLGRSREA